jgi:hypothetical protein
MGEMAAMDERNVPAWGPIGGLEAAFHALPE